MRVFVIVVTYNGKKWIDKCFGSLRLSELPLHVIVVDNASTDGTQDVIKSKYPEIDIIQSKKNLGFGGGNNLGIKKAYEKGADYVFLLNQDAWIESGSIKKLVEMHKKNPEYLIISPMQLTGSGNKLEYGFSNYVAPDKCPNFLSDCYMGNLKDQIYEADFVNAAAWLISRTCIKTVGGFNPVFFHYGEDDNYVQRVKFHGFKLGVYPFAKIFHDVEHREEPPRNRGKKLKEQMLLIKYSNPFLKNILERDLKVYRQRIRYSIIEFKFQSIKKYYEEYKKWKSLKSDILKYKDVSKMKGLSFLNELNGLIVFLNTNLIIF
ncbi:MAG: glycosyltransferase family 2 protein [Balneolaceae bacterium]